jgi:anti-sigma factor RsiW
MMNDDELSGLIRKHVTRHKASDGLRARIRTQITLQSAARGNEELKPGGEQAAGKRALRQRTLGQWWASQRLLGFDLRNAWLSFGLGVALTLAMTWGVPKLLIRDSLPAELVASHVRALKVGPMIEVASSDRHTVKPWFQGKLDYAPQVFDLLADGFPLMGGRVDQVAGKATAALVFSKDKHLINVFVRPSDRTEPPALEQRNGFSLIHWSEAAMQVWVVSDLEARDLERFARAWRNQLAAR